MGKIEALKNITPEIVKTVERIEKNTLSPNKNDVLYLVDRFNECNTSAYTHRDVTVCADCRRHVFKFWQNVVIEWKKTKR